jgi:hypothetical protein
MRKADAVHTLIPGIKVAVLFLDGGNLWTYESEDGLCSAISSMENIVSRTPSTNKFSLADRVAGGTYDEPCPFYDGFPTPASPGSPESGPG